MLKKTGQRFKFRVVIPGYPAFNIYSHIANRTTALGPLYVASVVNKLSGWDAEVIDENNMRRYGPRSPEGGADHAFIQAQRPADAVGLYGGLTSTIPRLYQVAAFYKGKGVTVVAGGQHFAGENIEHALRNNIDYLVLGEGEETAAELLEALSLGRDLKTVKGIAYLSGGKVVVTETRPPMDDFSALPYPDFSLVRYAAIKLYPIGRIRGCGMDCEFCTVRGRPRSISPEQFMEQIRYLVETYDARHFFVVDDLFAQYRDETMRFCGMLAQYQKDIGRRLDFTVQIRLDKARDSEFLAAMRRAGVSGVCIGFESPIEEELKAMNKHIRPHEMIEMARIYHQFGFLVHGMFIFGYPMKEGSSFVMSAKERVRRFKYFIRAAKVDTIQVLLPVPFAGTELRNRLAAQNRVYPLSDIGWEYYDGNFPLFEPDKPLTSEDIHDSTRSIMGKFYQFKYMFMLAFHVISFPALVFFLHNIKAGWRKWYRPWRNSLTRFGGWIIFKGWTSQFNKSTFPEKLKNAREHILPASR